MNAVVKIARTWIGTKFHHQGREKNIGVDCIGLIVGVAKEIGLDVNDKIDYARLPKGKQLQEELQNYLLPSEVQEGAIGLFKIDKYPQHVAIISSYKGEFGIIHSFAQSRKVVEHRMGDLWKERLIACYKFPI